MSRREVGVYVELDLGMRRVGVPSVDAAVALARHVSEIDGLRFEGLAFYPGHIREPMQDQDAKLEALERTLARAMERFHDGGAAAARREWRLDADDVANARDAQRDGDAPGHVRVQRPHDGHDGRVHGDDCALTVLATVVSTSVSGQAVIDAGTKALGREPMRGPGEGFGQLLDRPDVIVERMSEEHGVLDLSATSWRPSVGDVVQVVPNHVCIAVHLHDHVYGVRGGHLESSWPIEARGRGRSSS